MTMLEPSQQKFWQETELPLMSSRAASRAKTLASLENSAAWGKAQDPASGPRLSDLLASYDRATSSWRTSQHCLLAQTKNEADGLAEFSETWPSAGMMRNGKTYQRQPWALPIAESASGLWPTPTKGEAHSPFSTQSMLRKEAGLSRKSGAKIGSAIKWDRRALPYVVNGWINPVLTEWLMGFPIGHTALPPAETP
jgi:hypothetical protein